MAEADGKEVPWEDIVRGYQYEKGKFVVLNDDDFSRVDVEATQRARSCEKLDEARGALVPDELFEMANYYATARSNYFAVKDRAAFEAWAGEAGLEVLPGDDERNMGRVMITPVPESGGGWPSERLNRETGEWDEFDVFGELGGHLRDHEIAILFEVGSEKLRYVSGSAVAVNWQGDVECLDLNEIYERASSKFGVPVGSISAAEY